MGPRRWKNLRRDVQTKVRGSRTSQNQSDHCADMPLPRCTVALQSVSDKRSSCLLLQGTFCHLWTTKSGQVEHRRVWTGGTPPGLPLNVSNFLNWLTRSCAKAVASCFQRWPRVSPAVPESSLSVADVCSIRQWVEGSSNRTSAPPTGLHSSPGSKSPGSIRRSIKSHSRLSLP